MGNPQPYRHGIDQGKDSQQKLQEHQNKQGIDAFLLKCGKAEVPGSVPDVQNDSHDEISKITMYELYPAFFLL